MQAETADTTSVAFIQRLPNMFTWLMPNINFRQCRRIPIPDSGRGTLT